MTTLREAAQQALEALQGIYIAPEHDHYINAWWPACRDAIPALRAALAQEQAEPVQEPVYWEVRCAAHPRWMRVDEQQFDEYVAHGWEGQKLYTAPPKPKPKREPLTDEEIERIRADEREACAKVCEDDVRTWSHPGSITREECAAAIRARSKA